MLEWDPFGSAELEGPAGAWERLRRRCPVARSERQGGCWAVSRYGDAVEIARDAETFNNSGGPQFETARPPLEVDRPEHTFFRRVLQPSFAKERVARPVRTTFIRRGVSSLPVRLRRRESDG